MNHAIRSFIVLYSEAIWIYCAIVLFSDNQWTQGPAADLKWWLAAAIAGYALHAVLAGRAHYGIVLGASVLALGAILYANWRAIVPESGWTFQLSAAIAVIFVFVRGAGFVYRRPNRLNMLGRFEGNVIFYLLFLLLYTAKGWSAASLHLMYPPAIFAGLMGMTLALNDSGGKSALDQAEVRIAGRSGWFSGIVALLAAGIALLSLLLLLPAVQSGLQALALGAWDALRAALSAAGRLIAFLISLLPDPEPGEIMPLPGETLPELPEQPPETALPALPLAWIVGGIAVLAAVAGLAGALLFLKHARPVRPLKPPFAAARKSNWLVRLLALLKAWRHSAGRWWRMRFPRYYRLEVFWAFHRVQAWAGKNGLPRLRTETPGEFIEKIIHHLNARQTAADGASDAVCGDIPDRLRRLKEDYQSAYYGEHPAPSAETHRKLLRRLKKLRLVKTPRRRDMVYSKDR